VARARLLLACLGLFALEARADWTPVGRDNGADSSIFAAYADRATVRRDGALSRMQGMYDFPRGDFTPAGRHLYSTIVEREYDCGARKVRLLRYADHAGHGGDGEIVGASNQPRGWEDILEDSLDAAYLKIACEAI
jgi:hypothetical protein